MEFSPSKASAQGHPVWSPSTLLHIHAVTDYLRWQLGKRRQNSLISLISQAAADRGKGDVDIISEAQQENSNKH